MPFYHATTADRIESIRRHGLGGLRTASKAFPNCPDGVYLAADPMFALGFLLERALAGDFVHQSPKVALAQFRVIVIDDSRVDRTHLTKDPNISQAGFWLYDRIVDVTAMPVVTAEDVTRASFAATPVLSARRSTS
jgi:hypothetical protein